MSPICTKSSAALACIGVTAFGAWSRLGIRSCCRAAGSAESRAEAESVRASARPCTIEKKPHAEANALIHGSRVDRFPPHDGAERAPDHQAEECRGRDLGLGYAHGARLHMPAQQVREEVDGRPRTLLERLREDLRESIGLRVDDALQPQAGGRGGIGHADPRHRRQCCFQIIALYLAQGLDGYGPLFDGTLHRSLEECRFVRVAGIDGAFCHADRGGDCCDGGYLEALLEEQLECAVEQLLMTQLRLLARRTAGTGPLRGAAWLVRPSLSHSR